MSPHVLLQLARIKKDIVELVEKVLAEPETHVAKLKELEEFLSDQNTNVQFIALASCRALSSPPHAALSEHVLTFGGFVVYSSPHTVTEVFTDILPDYRIRINGTDDVESRVSL